jgi:hypothetical protein
MARVQTLEEMREDVRERADMVNTQFMTDAVINRWLNKAICDLHDVLIHVDPGYSTTSEDVVTTVGTDTYELPADFMQVRTVFRLDSAGIARYPIQPFGDQEAVGGMRGMWPRYQIRGTGTDGQFIIFDPDPGAYTYRVLYVTAAPVLAADDDEFDGISGWEDWPILRVAISCLNKEKQDSSALERELMRVEQRARALAGMRDSGEPPAIVITRPSLRRGTRRFEGEF